MIGRKDESLAKSPPPGPSLLFVQAITQRLDTTHVQNAKVGAIGQDESTKLLLALGVRWLLLNS
jgi:hypothetical protein